MDNLNRQQGLILILALLAAVGVALSFFVHRNTTSISDALAAEVLEQQSDVAVLLYEYDRLMIALETQRLSQGAASSEPLLAALVRTEKQLEAMRFNYSFERLDGASTAHAYIKPVLEDVRQWLTNGVPGVLPDQQQMIAVASLRVQERHDRLWEIMQETGEVADALINTQTGYLTRFGKSLMFMLMAFALLVAGVVMLLTRQRDLQSQMVAEQRQHALRIKHFADTGADWFWEMNSDMRLRWLSGRTLSEVSATADSTQSAYDMEKGWLPDYAHAINIDDWPMEKLANHLDFTDHEAQWLMRDGEKKTVAVSGIPLFSRSGEFDGYRGVGRDITARKNMEYELHLANKDLLDAETRGRQQAEQALRDSEMFLRTSLNAVPQRLAILNDDGVVLEANTAWLESMQLGDVQSVIAGGEVIGSHYADVYSQQVFADNKSLQEVLKQVDAVLQGQSGKFRSEFSLTNAHDVEWLCMAISPFYSNSKRYCVLAVEVVSERRLLEERDRQLRADLAHFSRLTTVGELATGLAHELNQPLTAISHNCDALLSGIEATASLDEVDVEAIHAIHSEANRAGAIIRGLRKMVRKETGGITPTNLNQLITETSRLGMPDATKHGITVRLQLAPELPLVEIDAVQIQQVLVNLERNGVEAIRSSSRKPREMIISTAALQNGSVRVTVQDSGDGLAATVRDELFSPFLTTKKDGMGMGLSISRSIIESHGGQLWVDLDQPTMTTFSFTLPVEHPESRQESGFLPARAVP